MVDVPGHERFIKSMVAGAGGVDLVMLVVAADEGVMPQTREHLDICQLLGVRRGVVALTKQDLVDADWLALVREDLQGLLRGTFLQGAPVVPCSATTGAGLPALRDALLAVCAEVPARDPDGLLRLPLDRVFTIKGFGTVVTGTLLTGRVRVGEEVAVLPAGTRSKVRGVQVHSEAVEQAEAGQRTAVNLAGVDRQEVARGEVLVHPDTLWASPMIDVSVELLPGVGQALKRRSKVLFHLGTRQQEASCVLLDAAALDPGQQALAQLRFPQPVVALPGDRFILRGFRKLENYGTTVGGGEVIRVLGRKVRPRDAEAIALLRQMRDAGPAERVALEVLGAGNAGLSRVELQRRLPLVPALVDRHLQRLLELKQLVRFDKEEGAVIHAAPFAALKAQLLALVGEHHQQHPLQEGIGREELRTRLPFGVSPRLHHALLQDLTREGALAVEQQFCRLPGHQVQAAARSLRPLADEVLGIYQRAGLASPREAELAAQTGASAAEVADAVRLLVGEGRLLRLGGLLFEQGHVRDLQRRLVQALQRDGQITAQQFKELTGQSRKYAIPLAEYFDAQKVTIRVGEVRKLRG